MKATIQEGIRGDRLDVALPPTLRHRLPAGSTTPEARYTLVLFPHGEDDVVPSSSVMKALSRVDAAAQVVVAGWNFTEEARRDLGERGAIVISRSESPWTDEAHRTHRERMAALRGK